MNRVLIAAAAATTLFAAPVMAQSAKFAAVWNDGPVVVRADACAETDNLPTYCADGALSSDSAAVREMATIKIPQSKELLVGVSAQVELFTETLVKGKRGSYSRALAFAEGNVALVACNDDSCYRSKPGGVVLSSRQQELSAVLAGIIESCSFDPTPDATSGEASFNLGDCEVADEEIKLALTTMAAHHYNFVFPNLPQGEYTVIARFMTRARAEAEANCPLDENDELVNPYCLDGDGSAGAKATAIIGKTMVTIQEVRAINGTLGDPEPVIID